MRTYFGMIIVSLLVLGCKKDPVIKVNLHTDYYGLSQGRYVIYDVKEIMHLSNGQHDTIMYQLKTVIGDTVHDNAGRLGYKYWRYKRITSTDGWSVKDLWFTIIENNRAELTEENERIVKMVFAPTSDKTWNGNAFNTLEPMEYTYDLLHEPMTINGNALDSTVTVVQQDVQNLIQYYKKSEVYAKGIGMVKKHYQHLEISNFNPSQISTGKELYYNMITYGNE